MQFIRASLFLGLLLQVTLVFSSDYNLLMMDSQSGEPYKTAREALLKRLASLGYHENKNLHLTYHSVGNDQQQGETLLTQALAKQKYDAVFVNGTVMTLAAKKVAFNTEQPFIYTCVTDPVGLGVIDNFYQAPKANFTGVSYPVPVKSRLRFVTRLFPDVKTIGVIHADMPQSHSYNKWLKELLATNESFQSIKIIFRSVPLLKGEEGSKKMAESAIQHVKELNSKVDLFLSPNDQMGVSPFFPKMVYQYATKPLVGLTLKDVMEKRGATISIYPSQKSAGYQAANMLNRLFSGESFRSLHPEWPHENGFAFDLSKTKQFNIAIPIDMIELAGKNIVK